MDYSLQGSSVHGISQARILEWVAVSFSRGSSWPRDQIHVSCIAGSFFTTELPRKLYMIMGKRHPHSTDECCKTWRSTQDPCTNEGNVGKIPWRRKWQPTPVFLPGKSHGQRSLVDYSPWGRKESDTTEQVNNKNTSVVKGRAWANNNERYCNSLPAYWMSVTMPNHTISFILHINPMR